MPLNESKVTRTQTPNSSLTAGVLTVGLATLVLMYIFELSKQAFIPTITLWKSHFLTIFFTTIVSTCSSYFVGRRLRSLNMRLEERISDRTVELERANQELEVDRQQIALLSRMSELLQTCLDSHEAWEVIRQYGGQIFPGDSGALWIISESRNIVEAVGYWGAPPKERVFSPQDCWALRQGRAHIAESSAGMVCGHLGSDVAFPSFCLPLTAQSETLGLLHIEGQAQRQSPGTANPSGSRERLATAMAEQVALALANLKLRERLKNQSIRDPLTALFNRRYLEETLEREIRRSVRHTRPLTIIMLDLDHFKTFNDSFGHGAGDAVLKATGQLLFTFLRKEDIACRYGGEEFAIVLPEAPLDFAAQRAEELRKAFKTLRTQFKDQSLGVVTVSMGVANYPEHGSSGSDLLRAADSALYLAKATGRDRVVLASSQPETEIETSVSDSTKSSV
jgi:diguanylate cyclase (GGDEF)-like protein